MQLGWVDFSKEDREKVLDVVNLLQEQGAVDELGIGLIRDAFANYFFPGISTVQTRAKYFLIVPYILQEAIDGRYGNNPNTILRRIDEAEKDCGLRLYQKIQDSGQCMDGSFRDLAALRGTYRLIPEAAGAVKMMLGVLQDADVRKVNILLDQPVSNSGRLKALIADTADAGEYTFDLDIQILRDVDRQLYQKECVGTSDSVILDHCISWVNLAGECITRAGARSLRIWE